MHTILGLFNLGAGEIILILALLAMLLLVLAVVVGISLLIVRATRKTANPPSLAVPPLIQSNKSMALYSLDPPPLKTVDPV
jgi:hypothetical protein